MNWRKCGEWSLVAAVVLVALIWAIRQGPNTRTEQDVVTDSLIATNLRVLRMALDSLNKTAHERDSVLRLSDARGDSITALQDDVNALDDSLEAVLGDLAKAPQPTYSLDSAACNVALRLALRQREIIANQRDICASDRQSLREQLIRDSTEHRQQVARLLYRLDSTDKALIWERKKPRPCRVEFNFVLAKPTMSCGAAMGTSGGLGLLFGLLVQ